MGQLLVLPIMDIFDFSIFQIFRLFFFNFPKIWANVEFIPINLIIFKFEVPDVVGLLIFPLPVIVITTM